MIENILYFLLAIPFLAFGFWFVVMVVKAIYDFFMGVGFVADILIEEKSKYQEKNKSIKVNIPEEKTFSFNKSKPISKIKNKFLIGNHSRHCAWESLADYILTVAGNNNEGNLFISDELQEYIIDHFNSLINKFKDKDVNWDKTLMKFIKIIHELPSWGGNTIGKITSEDICVFNE